jgi:hypothetical protein
MHTAPTAAKAVAGAVSKSLLTTGAACGCHSVLGSSSTVIIAATTALCDGLTALLPGRVHTRWAVAVDTLWLAQACCWLQCPVPQRASCTTQQPLHQAVQLRAMSQPPLHSDQVAAKATALCSAPCTPGAVTRHQEDALIAAAAVLRRCCATAAAATAAAAAAAAWLFKAQAPWMVLQHPRKYQPL